jgi:hypothetical protein
MSTRGRRAFKRRGFPGRAGDPNSRAPRPEKRTLPLAFTASIVRRSYAGDFWATSITGPIHIGRVNPGMPRRGPRYQEGIYGLINDPDARKRRVRGRDVRCPALVSSLFHGARKSFGLFHLKLLDECSLFRCPEITIGYPQPKSSINLARHVIPGSPRHGRDRCFTVHP